jgi:hypothetical protein
MPTAIIRPIGDYRIQLRKSGAPYNWDCVDDITPDEDTTYVYNDTAYAWRDLYELSDVSFVGPINWIKVWFRCRSGHPDYRGSFWACIETHGQEYGGGPTGGGGTTWCPGTTYINCFETYTVNPYTRQPWTISEVNSLRAGVKILWNPNYSGGGLCTQVYVEINYIDIPIVSSSAATNIEETTATLGGNITDTGDTTCDQRGVEYGTQSGIYPYESVESGSFGTGAYTRNITGLSPGTRYYFRAKAHNTIGWGYGSELQFLTKPLAPTNLTVTDYSGDSISLSWTKGTGANRTMIRRKQGSYPTSITDGTQVYFGTGTSVTDSGLEPRQTYYYRAWSEVSADSLQQWSDDYAQVYQTTPLYYTTGWIGDVIDCGSTVKSYDRLEWDATIPTANESIMVQIRSSVNQVNWSDWQYVYSSPCTSFTIPVRRYLEWRARLSGDSRRTPVLHNLNFFWSKTS